MNSDKAISSNPGASVGQSAKLLQGCRACLAQCDQLLAMISPADYGHGNDQSASVGAHVRHVLDRFQCVFAGVTIGAIDYDARQRDQAVERQLDAARLALQQVLRQCDQAAVLMSGEDIVRVRETVDQAVPALVVSSTVERELMGLVSHSIHHLAIIALLMKARGYRLSADIGKAPSTLVYERA